MTYSEEDCIAAVQLVAWMTGQDITEVTIKTYRNMGMEPSYATIINHLGSWSNAKEIAGESPQMIPSHLPQFYQSVAALRRARDISGYPVTGLQYRDIEDEIGVPYLTALKPFPTWTRAKMISGIHNAMNYHTNS